MNKQSENATITNTMDRFFAAPTKHELSEQELEKVSGGLRKSSGDAPSGTTATTGITFLRYDFA
jgi:bacteriocin-like protein